MDKSPDAFRTITEVADWLDTPAHVLRFWESRFSQIKPVKRAGGRRYYRPIDMLLLGGIKKLLHDDGTTIKGVQKILREHGIKYVQSLSQPVAVQVSVKKKAPAAAVKEVAPIAPPPSPEPKIAPVVDPMAERAAMPADPVPTEISTPEPKAHETLEVTDVDDQDDLDLPQSASLGEPDISVIKFPEILKTASEISHKDMQEIEALYYSLKMVRNNMKRTGAGR